MEARSETDEHGPGLAVTTPATLGAMSPEDARAAVAATLSRLALAETDLGSLAQTIARQEAPSTSASLPRVSLVPGSNSDLTIVRELARGGMGIVHLAEQRSLDREVAVKTARSSDAAITSALVREARIMGTLEHPSLVPVHALGIDPEGAPVIVMKRIEGVAWRVLMNDASHDAWQPLLAGHGDRLRAHVEILAQICRALAFAHDRGVVHRDLKPDNVMIGRFGEVVLLDWGVALRMADVATEPHGIVGTPAYLAPEMARGEPALVDARTDVYLLGATLYEIVTGRMPHEAPTPVAALVHALVGEIPPLPEDLAPELAGLIRASMAAERDARTASAEAFRVGLMQFVAARDADVLVRDARAATTDADGAFAKDGASSTLAFRRLIEARFALVSALRLRPTDSGARAVLDGVVARLARRDLDLGSPAGARAYAAEMVTAQPELLAAITSAEAAIATEARARAERDTSPVSRALLWAMGLIVALWISFTVTVRGVEEAPIEPSSSLIAIGVLSIPLLGLAIAMRRRMLATQGTRRLMLFFAVWYASGPAFLLLAIVRGEPEMDLPPLLIALGFYVAAGAMGLLPELWPSIVLHVVVAAWVVHDASRPFATMSAFFFLNAAIVVRALWLRARSPG
jgi:serine/threonine protein kinase